MTQEQQAQTEVVELAQQQAEGAVDIEPTKTAEAGPDEDGGDSATNSSDAGTE